MPIESDFKPIIYKTKPDPKSIIKFILEYFIYLQLQNSFRGYDNYRYIKQIPCLSCNRNHSNYGIYDKWYGKEYCLGYSYLSNKFKFIIVA